MRGDCDFSYGRRPAGLLFACLVAVCLGSSVPACAAESEEPTSSTAAATTATVHESAAPTTAALEMARESAPVRRLAAVYTDAGATTAQLEQLRSLDAESYAMRNNATAADLARFRRQRERILTPDQLKTVRDRLRREFADSLRTPKPELRLNLDRATTGTE
jgi:hypothetical protein